MKITQPDLTDIGYIFNEGSMYDSLPIMVLPGQKFFYGDCVWVVLEYWSAEKAGKLIDTSYHEDVEVWAICVRTPDKFDWLSLSRSMKINDLGI